MPLRKRRKLNHHHCGFLSFGAGRGGSGGASRSTTTTRTTTNPNPDELDRSSERAACDGNDEADVAGEDEVNDEDIDEVGDNVDEVENDREFFELDPPPGMAFSSYFKGKKRRLSSGTTPTPATTTSEAQQATTATSIPQHETLYFRDYILRTMNEMLTSQLSLTRKLDRMSDNFVLLNKRIKSEKNCFFVNSFLLFKLIFQLSFRRRTVCSTTSSAKIPKKR